MVFPRRRRMQCLCVAFAALCVVWRSFSFAYFSSFSMYSRFVFIMVTTLE